MDKEKLDKVLRKLLEHLDYDLLKSYECDEESGEDTFTHNVTDMFLHIWNEE